MPKTKINKLNRKFKKDVSLTRKNKLVKVSKNNLLLNNFEKEIVVLFLEVLIMVKLFHWKTYSYATHKATDKLYSSLNEKMDQFIEILLGKVNNRISLIDNKTINLFDLTSKEQLVNKITSFKSYLVDLNNNKAFNLMSNYDLLTVRDEILGDINQFLYLLTFDK
jgi:hypothetical protein